MEEKIWKSHSAVKWDCEARLHDFGHSIRIANCIEDWKQDTKHDQVDDSNALQFETVFCCATAPTAADKMQISIFLSLFSTSALPPLAAFDCRN